jgi:hypothetical protein
MSEIRYFQRYSQKENVVTNNTLSFLYKLYLHSRTKFENVLNGLEENAPEISVGPRFNQQIGKGRSIIDGLLRQESFTIAIETKLYGKYDEPQLKRHYEHLRESDIGILIAIAKNKPSDELVTRTRAFFSVQDPSAHFYPTTFEDLILAVEAELNPHDQEMVLILEDYRAFCEENDLIDFQDRTLLAVPAGHSLQENLATGIYYESTSRNHSRGFDYLGLYHSRALRLVGKIEVIVETTYEHGQLKVSQEIRGKASAKQREDIASLIEGTKTGYGLHEKIRFYLVDAFTPTIYQKNSPGPLRGKKYFHLDQLPDVDFTTDLSGPQLAAQLDQKQWH